MRVHNKSTAQHNITLESQHNRRPCWQHLTVNGATIHVTFTGHMRMRGMTQHACVHMQSGAAGAARPAPVFDNGT